MKLAALLSFYDEQPHHLHRAITSLPIAHVTHLVVLDGAYAAFPGAKGQSPHEQVQAIETACSEAMLNLTLEQPSGPWAGNEMQKRTALFALAETVTDTDDWLLIIDADEQVITAPDNLHERLNATKRDVAEITFEHPGETRMMPRLFRAIRGVTVQGNHYGYRTPDGRNLWGDTDLEPVKPIHDMTIRHHYKERDPQRRVQRVAYYQRRAHLGLEQ